MELLHALSEMIEFLGLFGGMGLFFWMVARMVPEMKKQGLWQPPAPRPVHAWQIRMPFLDARQVPVSPITPAAQNDAVLQELKSLRQQVLDMQTTCHQFDISFDAALNRLEERVNRMETKHATQTAIPAAADEPQRIRLG